jgi:hypothetical protein
VASTDISRAAVKAFRRHHVGARQGHSVRHHVKALLGDPYKGHALKAIILDSNVWRRPDGCRSIPGSRQRRRRGAAPGFGRYLE